MKKKYLLFNILLLVYSQLTLAQPKNPNYDEGKIPVYTLPSVLESEGGTIVNSVDKWFNIRRPEIIKLFKQNVYGKIPQQKIKISFKPKSIKNDALNGLATRKQVEIVLSNNDKTITLSVLLYIPNSSQKPVPAFLGLNFIGNQSVTNERDIPITTNWVGNYKKYHISDHKAGEQTRGCKTYRWQIEKILKNGYAIATCHYGDIDPDFDDGFQNGIHSLFYKEGQNKLQSDEWGSIGAWAWGLSRILDYFEIDKDVDGSRVAVIGHSRLGKTALWAGALDQRFALVISNNSGCGGATLFRRRIGETVEIINRSFPHWFCGNFKTFNDKEDSLPVDQHMLISLIAPRPVYIASAEEDRWADPKGEFLSALNADPVYRLLKTDGFSVREIPAVNYPLFSRIGYHIRSGKHDLSEYDWQQYLFFADKFIK